MTRLGFNSLALVLALATAGCGATVSSGPPASPTGTSPASPGAATSPSIRAAPTSLEAAVALAVRDFTLDPIDVRVRQGVGLAVTNAGPTVHNVAIRDAAGAVVGTTEDLRTGESERLAVPRAAGTYTLFCSLPGHESLGIKGTLTVLP